MRYLVNEPLKKHTSFKIGGPADYFCVARNIEQVQEACAFAREKKIPLGLLGNGTNVIVLDKGFRGLVLSTAGGLNKIKVRGRIIRAGAGASLSQLLKIAVKNGLGGLEFMAGIPGTIGGAVAMNAGAMGKEIGKYIEQVKVVDHEGAITTMERGKIKFGYRQSSLSERKDIIIEVAVRLRAREKRRIKKEIAQILKKRRKAQPLGIPNAGSVFKNPPGNFAGQLLEEAECKGLRVGDAQVSVKHANFIVNLGEATAKEVLKLMTKMQKKVEETHKIKLEPEIKIMVESF